MRRFGWLIILICCGCQSSKSPAPVQIKLTNHKKTIAISGINEAILNDINRDSIKNWQSLASIYCMPADSSLKDYQPIQPGRYHLSKGALLFTPDTPFAVPRVYFVRYYNYSGNKTIWQYLKGSTSKGRLHYTDLIFKL